MKSTQSDTPRGRENFSTFNGENKDIGLDAAYLFGATYVTRHTLAEELWPPHMTSHMLAAALSPPLFHSKRQSNLSPTQQRTVIADHQLLRLHPICQNYVMTRTQDKCWVFYLLTVCFTAHLLLGIHTKTQRHTVRRHAQTYEDTIAQLRLRFKRWDLRTDIISPRRSGTTVQ